MRSDNLGNAAQFNGLTDAINQSQFLTPRLSRAELSDAISLPARVFDGEVEPILVNELLNEASNEPDQLPLLQHALMQLWRGNTDQNKILTFADYKKLRRLKRLA